ncbi:17699_t:CDS:2, partial [Rhizophagus irregularis]
TSLVIIKNFYILYLTACIGTEIWYLVTLRKIGDYNEHGVEITMSTMASWILTYEVSGDSEDDTIAYGLTISG